MVTLPYVVVVVKTEFSKKVILSWELTVGKLPCERVVVLMEINDSFETQVEAKAQQLTKTLSSLLCCCRPKQNQ